MNKVKYRLPYDDFIPDPIPELSQESDVDPTGYVPTEKRITNIMLAGAAVTAVTGDQFDYSEEVDDFDIDPTRSGNYDLVDAQRDMQRSKVAHDRLRQARIDAEAAKKAEGTQTPPEPSKTPPD